MLFSASLMLFSLFKNCSAPIYEVKLNPHSKTRRIIHPKYALSFIILEKIFLKIKKTDVILTAPGDVKCLLNDKLTIELNESSYFRVKL